MKPIIATGLWVLALTHALSLPDGKLAAAKHNSCRTGGLSAKSKAHGNGNGKSKGVVRRMDQNPGMPRPYVPANEREFWSAADDGCYILETMLTLSDQHNDPDEVRLAGHSLQQAGWIEHETSSAELNLRPYYFLNNLWRTEQLQGHQNTIINLQDTTHSSEVAYTRNSEGHHEFYSNIYAVGSNLIVCTHYSNEDAPKNVDSQPHPRDWSDITFLGWVGRARSTIRAQPGTATVDTALPPRWVLFSKISDPQTLAFVAACIIKFPDRFGAHRQVSPFGNLNFPVGTSGYLALLATKHGRDTADLLIKHKHTFGDWAISSVHLFASPKDVQVNTGVLLPSLLFRIRPVFEGTDSLKQAEQQNLGADWPHVPVPMRLELRTSKGEARLIGMDSEAQPFDDHAGNANAHQQGGGHAQAGPSNPGGGSSQAGPSRQRGGRRLKRQAPFIKPSSASPSDDLATLQHDENLFSGLNIRSVSYGTGSDASTAIVLRMELPPPNPDAPRLLRAANAETIANLIAIGRQQSGLMRSGIGDRSRGVRLEQTDVDSDWLQTDLMDQDMDLRPYYCLNNLHRAGEPYQKDRYRTLDLHDISGTTKIFTSRNHGQTRLFLNIYSLNNQLLINEAYHLDNIPRDQPGTWAHIAYLGWIKGRHTVTNPPTWILFSKIDDTEAVSAVTACVEKYSTTGSIPAVGELNFPIGSICYYVLLGTRYGQDAAEFLWQHKAGFVDARTISSISVFTSEGDTPKGSYFVPSLLFNIKDVDTDLIEAERANAAAGDGQLPFPMSLEFKISNVEHHVGSGNRQAQPSNNDGNESGSRLSDGSSQASLFKSGVQQQGTSGHTEEEAGSRSQSGLSRIGPQRQRGKSSGYRVTPYGTGHQGQGSSGDSSRGGRSGRGGSSGSLGSGHTRGGSFNRGGRS